MEQLFRSLSMRALSIKAQRMPDPSGSDVQWPWQPRGCALDGRDTFGPKIPSTYRKRIILIVEMDLQSLSWTYAPKLWLRIFRFSGWSRDSIGSLNQCRVELCIGRSHGMKGTFVCTLLLLTRPRRRTGIVRNCPFNKESSSWKMGPWEMSYKSVSPARILQSAGIHWVIIRTEFKASVQSIRITITRILLDSLPDDSDCYQQIYRKVFGAHLLFQLLAVKCHFIVKGSDRGAKLKMGDLYGRFCMPGIPIESIVLAEMICSPWNTTLFPNLVRSWFYQFEICPSSGLCNVTLSLCRSGWSIIDNGPGAWGWASAVQWVKHLKTHHE